MGSLKYIGLALVLAVAAIGCSDGGGEEPSFTPESQQCLSPSDMALLPTLLADAGVPDDGVRHSPLSDAQELCARDHCFEEMLSGQNPPVCLQDCIDMMATDGLSPGCRDCYVFSVTCTAEHCAAPCLAGSSTTCVDCTRMHCSPIVADCVGYTP